jgi:hypothetical protein
MGPVHLIVSSRNHRKSSSHVRCTQRGNAGGSGVSRRDAFGRTPQLPLKASIMSGLFRLSTDLAVLDSNRL